MNWIVFLLLITLSVSVPAEAETMKVITSDEPPYSYQREGIQDGYATALVQTTLKEAGWKADIEEYPFPRMQCPSVWPRNIMIYPLLRHSGNEDDFLWIGKITDRQVTLFRRREDTRVFPEDYGSTESMRIGAIRDTPAAEQLRKDGYKSLELVGTDIQNIRKLMLRRIDFLACDELIFAHAIEEFNHEVSASESIQMQDFEQVMTLPVNDDGYYIAMTQGSDPETVKSFQESFRKMITQGTIVEVAHWWTNTVEEAMLALYRDALRERGYIWNDYTVTGGAGTGMELVFASREEAFNYPHAMQSYAGPSIRDASLRFNLLSLNRMAEQEQWSKVLYPFVNNAIQVDGKYLAVPVNIQRVNWLWLNPRIFNAVGIEIPETPEAFRNAVIALNAAGYNALVMGDEDWQISTFFENLLLALEGESFYTSCFIRMDTDSLCSERMARTLREFRFLMQYVDRKSDDPSWTEAAGAIAEGHAAMYVMGDWVKNTFHKRGISYGENGYLCIAFPGTGEVFLNNTDVFIFPEHRERSRESQEALASVIMNPEVQEQFNRLKGSIPARMDMNPDSFDNVTKASMEALATSTVLPSFTYRQASPEEFRKGFLRILSDYIRSEESVEKTIEKIRTLSESITGEYR
ncbi:MAG: extracellular solute-binding protein [Spirochaetales bacterium]|nr:extracellular solute-binding protein [Spirochaetales bacterium]